MLVGQLVVQWVLQAVLGFQGVVVVLVVLHLPFLFMSSVGMII